MPNLVVYVPTSLWRRIEELGLADPKIEARKVARGALESWLSERGRTRETVVAEGASNEVVVPAAREVAGSTPAPEVPRSESRPTPAECGMSNRHSMNSKLKPCPRCGYPL